jgi:hypothetical protein
MKTVAPVPIPVSTSAGPKPVKTSHLIAIYGIGVLIGALTMAIIGDVVVGSKPAPVAQLTPVAPNPPADLLAAAPAAGGPAAGIIANLGHPNFSIRRQAEAQLAAMGPAVIPQLQQAAQSHKDEEVRLRAQKVMKAIEAGEGVQVAGGGRAARKEEEEEEEDPAAMMEAMAQQQMMEVARAELAKARAQMERLGLTGRRGGAGGRIGNALGQMLGQQMGQLEQGVKQNNPNQEAPELPKLQLPQNRAPAHNDPPPMQVDPPQPPAGGDTTNLKSSYGAVFGNASGAVRVVDVQPNTAAAKAGLRAGDLVTKINGRAVESGDDVQAALAQIRPGQQYRIELNRKGEPLSLTAIR